MHHCATQTLHGGCERAAGASAHLIEHGGHDLTLDEDENNEVSVPNQKPSITKVHQKLWLLKPFCSVHLGTFSYVLPTARVPSKCPAVSLSAP